ncbi:Sister chromatid cohesion protein (Eso1), putative [Penicillium digitatum PHI26]|uniref:DNA polymerase eta n=2 Tax=Penicillium digitatum TaxID=36651 RepID=K9GBV5_PEND2|nr:Sister chromatid cohesion protein (Eso1), putative [Penicillium digitatum Pd1]EKV10771.1 Sister chromatid cohesion protein (Eso1), putative [Penicillium digitatum PHI26]EKV13074.1 Sister chromatid cohesion protein (Eso1), putative [Penicillium digitatum Pd1]
MSEPTETSDPLKVSRFTYRQLQGLRQGSTATPLRVIAHIDLDAFYAQCEMVRLGTSREIPLAVRQWDSLIAINYAARAFGVSRLINVAEARKLCPDLVLQHVATFREGEGGRWAYRDDSFRNISTDKVSLDPYRAQSRRILQTMKEALATWNADGVGVETQNPKQELSAVVEKASIDEVFIDLSPLIYRALLQRYPELRMGIPNENRDAELPVPPTTALQWNTDCLVDLDKHETEEDDPDWDDVVMLIGSEIVRSVRSAVWEKLSYTCSAGLGRNKMIAKLGSACNKPNLQTVVRNRAVQNFLGGYKFTQIRMLGGKLGDQITAAFGTEKVSELLNAPLEQLRTKLADQTATWLYGIIRGEDRSEVNPRTQIKSMLSAKSFRPSINSLDQAEKWLRIFAADIYGRLVEDGVLENRRRPKVITMHHRTAQSRSRQIPIASSSAIDENLLYDLANSLLRQVVADGQAWPCSNLSLSVSSFEDGVSNNKAIEGFLIRGDQAKALSHSSRPRDIDNSPSELPSTEKRRKLDGDGGKSKIFFGNSSHLENTVADEPDSPQEAVGMNSGLSVIPQFVCPRCSKSVFEHGKEEHDDWHFAKDLASQDREEAKVSQPPLLTKNSARGTTARGRGGRGGGSRGKPEKGQMRLAFQ